jgi:hypothetical protein
MKLANRRFVVIVVPMAALVGAVGLGATAFSHRGGGRGLVARPPTEALPNLTNQVETKASPGMGTNGSPGSALSPATGANAEPLIARAWDGNYRGSGYLTATVGTGQYSGQAPPFFYAGWDSVRNGFREFGDLASGGGLGTDILCPDPTCANITAIFLRLPYDQGSHQTTVTIGAPIKTALPWRSLQVSDTRSEPTTNGRYILTVSRSAINSWVFVVRPNPAGPGPWSYLTTARLGLTVTGRTLPWQTMHFTLAAGASGGSAHGWWNLALWKSGARVPVQITASPSPR